jgi:hypothetical protein
VAAHAKSIITANRSSQLDITVFCVRMEFFLAVVKAFAESRKHPLPSLSVIDALSTMVIFI